MFTKRQLKICISLIKFIFGYIGYEVDRYGTYGWTFSHMNYHAREYYVRVNQGTNYIQVDDILDWKNGKMEETFCYMSVRNVLDVITFLAAVINTHNLRAQRPLGS